MAWGHILSWHIYLPRRLLRLGLSNSTTRHSEDVDAFHEIAPVQHKAVVWEFFKSLTADYICGQPLRCMSLIPLITVFRCSKCGYAAYIISNFGLRTLTNIACKLTLEHSIWCCGVNIIVHARLFRDCSSWRSGISFFRIPIIRPSRILSNQ